MYYVSGGRREMRFEELWSKAEGAARAAHAAALPQPMVVAGGGQAWFVSEGCCGFGWVSFPGNGSFGKWAKAAGKARKHWPKGLYVSTNYGSQSIERAEAAAHAFAKVLREGGVEASPGSRMD
jgi:hypothetical protein